MSLAVTVRAMVAAGATPEMILAVVEAHEAHAADALAQRRANDAARQKAKRSRDRHVTSRDVTQESRDIGDGKKHNENNDDGSSLARVEYTTLPSEEVITPLTTPSGSTPRKAKSPPLGSRLPDDWSPDIGAAMALGLSQQQAAQQADRFRDYWRAVPGAKGRKLDWPATWRNWCRTALENLPKSRQDHAQRPDAKRAAREENYARAFAASGGIAGG